MALIACRECGKPVSTEATACPQCGAPPLQLTPPKLPVQPPPLQPKELIIYSDSSVAVTSTRVIIGGTIYSLRNITSVRMTFSPPPVGFPILLLLFGAFFLLLMIIFPFHENNSTPLPGFVLSGGIVGVSILWLCKLKTQYHVNISSAAGEIHALTSKNQAYVQRILLSVNEAIARHQ